MDFFKKSLGSAFDEEPGDTDYEYENEGIEYEEEEEESARRKPQRRGGLFGRLRGNDRVKDEFEEEEEEHEQPAYSYERQSTYPRSLDSARETETPTPMRRIRLNSPVLFNTFPKSMEDCSIIGDRVKAGNIVVVNVEGIDPALAQRISDFASGLCYGVDGNYRKLSDFVFVVSDDRVSMEGSYPGNM